VLSAVVAAFGGDDNTGETVRVSSWADDVCGTVGAWEGQVEAIGDEVELSNVGARRNDGGSGDHVEGTLYVRGAIERALDATNETLQEGLKRAGFPDVPQGRQASTILQDWAQDTENGLLIARATLRGEPNTTSAAFRSLGVAVAALERSAVEGRAAFRQVAALDQELADALDDRGNCRRLMEDQP
jgi:hypothetical protein